MPQTSYDSKEAIFIKFLAFYQIVFGTISLLLLFLSSVRVLGSSPFLYFILICLFLFSIISGNTLRKYKSEGLQLSLINQYIQLIDIKIFGYGFSAHTGIAGYFGFTDKPNLNFNLFFEFFDLTNSTTIYLNEDNLSAISLYLNIFPLALIILINRFSRSKTTSANSQLPQG